MERLPLSSISGQAGRGGIACNEDGTIFAAVDSSLHCVRIYHINAEGERVGAVGGAYVYGTTVVSRKRYEARFACFVRRGGVDTLLVCTSGLCRVIEVTVAGARVREITVSAPPKGVAYCQHNDTIAVTLGRPEAQRRSARDPRHSGTVVLLKYSTLTVFAEISSPQRCNPHGLRYTTDGTHIIVADYNNCRVSLFRACGAFVSHIAALTELDGFSCPTDVLQCEDGSIVIASTRKRWVNDRLTTTGSVKRLQMDGAMDTITFPPGFVPNSLSYSRVLNGVCVKEFNGSGRVMLLRDAWYSSRRCSWVSATCVFF